MIVKTSLYSVLILTSLVFSSAASHAQDLRDSQTDSLVDLLTTRTGKEKITIQLELALQLIGRKNAQALIYSESALEESKSLGDRKLEMRAYYNMGRIVYENHEPEQALEWYDTALNISDQLNEHWYKSEILFWEGAILYRQGELGEALNKYSSSLEAAKLAKNYKTMASTYSMMGTLYRTSGIYDRAIEYIIKAKLNYDKAGLLEGEAWVSYLLGRIYKDLNSFEIASEYFHYALEIYKRLAALDGKKTGIAICHEQLSLLHIDLGEYDIAREHIDTVFDIYKDNKSKMGMMSVNYHYGLIEYSLGKYNKAEDYFNTSLALRTEVEDKTGMPYVYERLGLCLIGKGKIDQGLAKINQGLDIAISKNQKKIESDIYSRLAEVHISLNNSDEAVFYLKKQIETQKELASRTVSIKMEQLQALYELDLKNEQIKELEELNEINALKMKQHKTNELMMTIGILFILVIMLTVYFYNRKLNKKNQQLNSVNRTKDKLFSVISHDLKGPVGSVIGLNELLLSDSKKQEDSELREYYLTMHKSLTGILDLLNNLLQWVHSQGNRLSFNPELLPLEKIINDTLKPISTLAAEKNINIYIEMDTGFKVFADINMLKTILRNLISNAIKFSHKDGSIRIKASKQHNEITICVRDFGIGMSGDTARNLFSPDSNSPQEGTSGEKGTGLGLILCKEFIEVHKGRIWVESETGKGSQFCFVLPG